MNSILRIYVPLTLNVIAQHTKILTTTLDLTPDILKQPIFSGLGLLFSHD